MPNAEEEDDLLAGFFTEISNKPEPTARAARGEAASEEPTAEEPQKENTLTEKYVNQDLGDGRAQVERLTGSHYEWRNLNPYAVFQLDVDATEEDIKYRYKKLSLKVHPDRLRNVEKAREAFEEVPRRLCMHCVLVISSFMFKGEERLLQTQRRDATQDHRLAHRTGRQRCSQGKKESHQQRGQTTPTLLTFHLCAPSLSSSTLFPSIPAYISIHLDKGRRLTGLGGFSKNQSNEALCR